MQDVPANRGSNRPMAVRSWQRAWRTDRPAGENVEGVALRQYAEIVDGYRSTGGLTSGDEVARWLRAGNGQPISTLARWIVDRQIVCIEWQGHLQLPLFQFDRTGLGLLPMLQQTMAELAEVFDDWNAAAWFATPNCWLDDARPAEALARRPVEVLDAARADRFIAGG